MGLYQPLTARKISPQNPPQLDSLKIAKGGLLRKEYSLLKRGKFY